MLPKFHVVLASAVSTISTHCTAIVSFVLTNGPVKMFVAAALDEMMAGWLADDANEPLYINVLAPDSETAGAPDPAVIVPIMFIVAADEHANPTAPDPPTTDPDTLMLVAVVDTPADVDPPVIDPVIVRLVPVNSTAICPVLLPPPPVTFPFIVRLPTN